MPEVLIPQGLDAEWRSLFEQELQQSYFKQLLGYLEKRQQEGAVIFPPSQQWFNAFLCTPLASVKVVILGQDPYHGAGQAHGLSFSVPKGVALPPSLRNIYKELSSDLSVEPPLSGDLTHWAKQGVLLLNAVLTVEEKRANSHARQGWEIFTDRVIRHLAENKQSIVFVLWGAYAQQKAEQIDLSQHKVISAPHPSPLSAYRGFFGTKPFSTINSYLISEGKAPVDW